MLALPLMHGLKLEGKSIRLHPQDTALGHPPVISQIDVVLFHAALAFIYSQLLPYYDKLFSKKKKNVKREAYFSYR